MIPICLVTGFLGSGKTSFVKHLAAHTAGRRIVYLINEFSTVDIDGGLVADDAGDVVAIPGGSIFCRCLVTEFVGALGRVASQFHTPESPVEGVVIEATGMAKPGVIGDLLRETRLDLHFRLASVVAVVDPGSFEKLVAVLPSIAAQIEAATVVLLNKTDRYDAQVLARVENAIAGLRPGVPVVRTRWCATQVDVFGTQDVGGALHGEYALCRDPNYETRDVDIACNIDLETFRERLAALADDFYRVKGFVPADGQIFYLDYSAAGLVLTPGAPPDKRTVLVFILRGDASPAAQAFIDEIAAGGIL